MSLRILHVSPFFSPRMGGMPLAVHQTAFHLTQRGHSNTVLTSDFDLRDSQFPEAGYRLVALPASFARGGFYVTPGLPGWIQEHIREFDVIHMHTVRTYQNIFVRQAALRERIPYVISAHGTLPITRHKWFAKRAFDALAGSAVQRDAQRWIAVSPKEREQYQQAGIPSRKIKLIFNGLASEDFNNLPENGTFRNQIPGITPDTPLILFLGRIHPLKDVDYLIDAFAEFRNVRPQSVLLIAGPDDGDLHRLRRRTEMHKLTGPVRFVGPLDRQARLAALVDADVLAHPSASEIFGFVVFEALLCGTPVIVNAASGAGQIVKAAGCGYTIPRRDVSAFSKTIYRALTDSSSNHDLVSRGQAFIGEQMNWTRIVRDVERAYAEAMEPGSALPSGTDLPDKTPQEESNG
jgi:glycosyltransferase involved in cell wall biosynthesis